VVMIVPESVPVAAGGGALLPSGVSAELVDARWPHVRVLITAPSGQALDVAQLVRKSGALGIFGSLLAVPRGQSAEGAEEPVQLAHAEPGVAAPSPLPLEEPPAIQESIQVALRAETPAPIAPAMGDDDIAAPAIALAEAPPQAAMPPAMGEDVVVAPVIAFAEAQPQAPVLPAAVEEIIAAPVIALAEAPTTAAVEPLILAAVDTGTMHDGAVAGRPVVEAPVPVEPVVAAPQLPQASAPAVSAEQPVIVASAEPNPESSVRRVSLVASDTPVWPAPVKLERVERRMPVIMFDRKGGIFHL